MSCEICPLVDNCASKPAECDVTSTPNKAVKVYIEFTIGGVELKALLKSLWAIKQLCIIWQGSMPGVNSMKFSHSALEPLIKVRAAKAGG